MKKLLIAAICLLCVVSVAFGMVVCDEIKNFEPTTAPAIPVQTTTRSDASTTAVLPESTTMNLNGQVSQNTQIAGENPQAVTTVSDVTENEQTTTAYTEPHNNVTEVTYINGILIANKTYALPSGYNPGGLTSETLSAFYAMQSDASALGLNLYISSGFRSYSTQNSIYNRYVSQDGTEAADRYSARPGHSEHQTGLAIDLNSISSSFADTQEGKWVAENCYKYGFIIRYPADKEAQTGYLYEPWHIRYLGVDTATAVYNSGLCLEEYLGITSAYSVG